MQKTTLKQFRGTVYICIVNACPKVALDIEKIKQYLELNRYRIIDDVDKADNILIFGCAFNNTTEKEALDALEKYKRYPGNLFVLEGIADVIPEKLKKLGIDQKKIIGRREFEKLDNFFGHNYKLKDLSGVNKCSITLHEYFHEYFVVQVCWGCNSYCSYCGDKIVVKNLKSKPIKECINEIKKGISKGYKKIHLLGDDVGAYGLDINSSIVELLNKIIRLDGDFELSIEEINVKYLISNLKELEKIFSSRKIKWTRIGVQSGNDRILKLMNRGYTRQELQNLFNTLSNYSIKLLFHTIVGFPTETLEEFKETLNLIKNNIFDSGIIFKYQDRKYTPAHKIFPKISEEEINSRLKYAIKYLDDKYYSNFSIANGKKIKNPKNSDRLNIRKKQYENFLYKCLNTIKKYMMYLIKQ